MIESLQVYTARHEQRMSRYLLGVPLIDYTLAQMRLTALTVSADTAALDMSAHDHRPLPHPLSLQTTTTPSAAVSSIGATGAGL